MSFHIVFRTVTPFRLLYLEDGGTTPYRNGLTTCPNTPVFIITANRTSNTAHDINVCVLRDGSTTFVVSVFSLEPGYLSRYKDSLRAGRSGDRILVGARYSAPLQTGPMAHPASYTMGTGSFQGVKLPGRGVDHPPHLALRLKKE